MKIKRWIRQIESCDQQFEAITAQIGTGNPSLILVTYWNERLEFLVARLDSLRKRVNRLRRELRQQKLERDAAGFQLILEELRRHGSVVLTVRKPTVPTSRSRPHAEKESFSA